MARTQRLLDLIQLMREHRRPVSAEKLADRLGVSVRTIYRDIDSLRAQGADIAGEAGIGYLLRPGFLLPPLMLTEDEIEALIFGYRWVSNRGDLRLAAAARSALTKITAVLPSNVASDPEQNPLLVAPSCVVDDQTIDPGTIRDAIRREVKIAITYARPDMKEEQRIVWPIALGYFESALILVAWCELRQDYRHFRLDRMSSLLLLPERYPQRRRGLFKNWQAKENISLARLQ